MLFKRKEIMFCVVFNVLSVFDTENWIDPSDEEKINIALYHGSISGCRTDIGWKMEHEKMIYLFLIILIMLF